MNEPLWLVTQGGLFLGVFEGADPADAIPNHLYDHDKAVKVFRIEHDHVWIYTTNNVRLDSHGPVGGPWTVHTSHTVAGCTCGARDG